MAWSSSPLYGWGHWGSQKLSNWPKVAHWELTGPIFEPRLLNLVSWPQPYTSPCLQRPMLVFSPPLPTHTVFGNKEGLTQGVSPFSNPSPPNMQVSLEMGQPCPQHQVWTLGSRWTEVTGKKKKKWRGPLHCNYSPQSLIYHMSLLLDPGLVKLMILRKKPYQRAPR